MGEGAEAGFLNGNALSPGPSPFGRGVTKVGKPCKGTACHTPTLSHRERVGVRTCYYSSRSMLWGWPDVLRFLGIAAGLVEIRPAVAVILPSTTVMVRASPFAT